LEKQVRQKQIGFRKQYATLLHIQHSCEVIRQGAQHFNVKRFDSILYVTGADLEGAYPAPSPLLVAKWDGGKLRMDKT
jgi:hypothetical protein